MRIVFRGLILIALFGVAVFSYANRKKISGFFGNKEVQYCKIYDDSSGQKPVLTHEKLDSILDALSMVHYSKLPEAYVINTESEGMQVLHWREYYKIRGTDIFKYLVGHFRIGDCMSKDTFYQENLIFLPEGCDQYWLTDRKLLHKFLDLILWMRKNNYNDSALTVKNGHRHPGYNKKVGGVSRSYHMQGMAIDLKVGDINRDGEANALDKQILLRVLETDIIRDEGGLGKYPGSDVIHFDTRGFRARWDKQ